MSSLTEGGKSGEGKMRYSFHAQPWFKDSTDIVITVIGVVVVVVGAFTILQTRSTAAELKKHSDIQAQAAVLQCYQQNAEGQVTRDLLLRVAHAVSKQPGLLESIQTYLAGLEDTNPRLSECRQLAKELEVSQK